MKNISFALKTLALVVVALPLCFLGFILGILISPIRAGIEAGMDWMETPPDSGTDGQ